MLDDEEFSATTESLLGEIKRLQADLNAAAAARDRALDRGTALERGLEELVAAQERSAGASGQDDQFAVDPLAVLSMLQSFLSFDGYPKLRALGFLANLTGAFPAFADCAAIALTSILNT